AAGLLDGRPATSHWLALDQLRAMGAEPTLQRVVFDGKIVTAAGVSSGIDMALALAERIAGADVAQAIQLGVEYDPQPPFAARPLRPRLAGEGPPAARRAPPPNRRVPPRRPAPRRTRPGRGAASLRRAGARPPLAPAGGRSGRRCPRRGAR